MARGNLVDLATINFPTQTAAADFFEEMLNRYGAGQRVDDIDALHLAALLERHTEYQDKVGVGVDHFEVMTTQHGTQCFRVVRTDSTGTDFSYLHCIRAAHLHASRKYRRHCTTQFALTSIEPATAFLPNTATATALSPAQLQASASARRTATWIMAPHDL